MIWSQAFIGQEFGVAAAAAKPDQPSDAASLLARSPIVFEPNQGQVAGQVQYLARGQRYGFYLSATQAVFALPAATSLSEQSKAEAIRKITSSQEKRLRAMAVLTMHLVGANPQATGSGAVPLASHSNYFLGRDCETWRVSVPHFEQVKYKAVYPGIDVVYYGNQRELEYDFVVAPGADPTPIRLAFAGARNVRVNAAGELVLTTATGELRQHKPVIYQNIQGVRKEVSGGYVVRDGQAQFALGAYDHCYELVIDPSLVYSTYLGGSGDEIGNGIETDAAGNAYVTGITYSPDFPVRNALQQGLRGYGNAFIAKFSPTGQLLFNTFLGGSGEDVGFAIALDSAANIYVTGSTDSQNFPVTSGAFQADSRGRYEGFIAKLSTSGDRLFYATYVGGQRDDVVTSIAVDATGNAYVTGQTLSPNFPLRGGVQNTLNGPSDAFVVKLNVDGSAISYATLLGGRGQDVGNGIVVDASANAYVTGITYSDNFPLRNAAQSQWGGRVDGFLTKFNSAGNGLVYSTYFGGAHDDGGYGLGLDSANNVFVTGFTTSTNFPTRNPFQASNAGGDDAIIAKYDANGALAFASYHGGSGMERAFDIAVTRSGDAYYVGRTESANFPLKDALQGRIGGGVSSANSLTEGGTAKGDHLDRNRSTLLNEYGRDRSGLGAETEDAANLTTQQAIRDGFVAKLSGATDTLVYSTFLGGTDEEKVFSIAADNVGNVVCTGLAASANFPTRNPAQDRLRGIIDGFVTKIADQTGTQASVSAANYRRTLARGMIAAAFGKEFTPATQLANVIPLPTKLADITVMIRDANGLETLAPLFFISPAQINYYIPAEVASGAATIAVYAGDILVSRESVEIANAAPGLFTINATGSGLVAGVALRVKADGSQSYEPLARFDAVQNRFVPVPINMGAATDQIFLVLFGTGIGNLAASSAKGATIGGLDAPILYVGAQGQMVGLDQINLQLPRSLVGRGEVDLVLTLAGESTNTVRVSFQ